MSYEETREKFLAYETRYQMRPGSSEWERAWAVLTAAVGTLNGWQYMGPDSTFTKHAFRLRAGVGGNDTGANRWEYIDARETPHQEVH